MNCVLFLAALIVVRSRGTNGEHFPMPCSGYECDNERLYNYPESDLKQYDKNKIIDKELTELGLKLANSHGVEDYIDDGGLVLDSGNDPKGYSNRNKFENHKKPDEDRLGWVTMEAVPWSVSKVSKWKPNAMQRPHRPSWDDDATIETIGGTIPTHNKFKKRPSYWNPDPYEEEESPQAATYTDRWSSNVNRRPFTNRKPCDDNRHQHIEMEHTINTDLRVPYRPYVEQQSLKKPFKSPTEMVYNPYFEDQRNDYGPTGDGEWVLLSTTKGYQSPKRNQRSMTMYSKPVRMHRSVKLTVLPMDDKNKRNMTLSHGGLLEVERTFKSVEETKKDADKKSTLKAAKIISPVDSSSVYAAVGAGMVPATMAMVLPMMLGRKRKKREVEINERKNPRNIFKQKY